MNWDAAGAIGEVVGAAAVVISVVYLAVQVRRQTDQSRLAATRELASQYNNCLDRIIDGEKLGEIWLKAAENYDALPNAERLRMASLYQSLMRSMEQQYIHVKQGNVDPLYFASLNLTYFELLSFPGVQQWWDGSKNMFEDEFRKLVDEKIASAKSKGYSSTFKSERENSASPGAPADA